MSLVLVADDEPAVLEVLTEVVEDLGHQVLRAHDGREALHLARQQKPNLVVTDHMMPRLSGVELCRAMRSDDLLRFVPVILLSAALPPEASEASAWLAKPFELDEFEALVTRTLLSGEATPEERSRTPLPEARSKLVQWMAYEMKTPLAAARAHLQLLDRKLGAAGAVPDGHHLRMVTHQLDALEQVIDRVADASSLAQGQLAIELGRVELHDVVREAVNLWREREPGLQIDFEASRDVAVRGDRRRLSQILGTLLSKVIRQGAAPQRVRVELDVEGSSALLRVRDMGTGLTPVLEEQPQRAETGGDAAPPPAAGTDFGLYLVSELVRLQEGTIQLRAAPGGNPSFTVTLPLAG